jgi:hypothetical protein
MAVPRTARRQPQLSSQAQINAVLRYAPQRQALAQAASEAREQHDAAIAGAQSESRLNQANVINAAPAVQGIYDRATQSSSAARAQLASVLQGLGPSAQNFQAAAATEGAQGAERTAREGAAATSALRSQSLAVAAAPAFARTLADQQLGKTLSKLLSTQQGLDSQQGLATASELEREAKEGRQEALTKRGQDITAQSDQEGHEATREGNQITAKHYAAADTPGGGKPLSADKQRGASETIRELEGKARALRQHGYGPQQVYAELTREHPEVNHTVNVVKRDEKGKAITNSKGEVQYEAKTTKHPKIAAADTLLSQAAIDSVYGYGRVSKQTMAKLHKAGYSLEELELQPPPPGGWKQAAKAPAPNIGSRRNGR